MTNLSKTRTDADGRDGGLGPAGTPGAHSCVIRSVTVRVAGLIVTEAFAHHFGTESQQVGVRAGDTLTYVLSDDVAEAVARAFVEAVALAERVELRHSVSPTWLGIETGTFPPSLMQRLVAAPATSVGSQPRRAISGQLVPAHVWVRVGPVLWQVCDRVAADRLAHVWSSCARLLAPEPATRPQRARTAPSGPSVPDTSVGSTPDSAAQRERPQTQADADADERSEAELLAAYVAGDAAALGILAHRRRNWVAAAARRVLGPYGDVEDVVQTTWLNVARSADRFEGRSSVATWLWRIAFRAALDSVRAATPVGTQEQDLPGTEDVAARVADACTVGRLLEVVTADQRAAIELVDLQGMDVAAAAALLSVAEGTVKSRLSRGRLAMAREASRLGLEQGQ